jgi:hypothetical protein
MLLVGAALPPLTKLPTITYKVILLSRMKVHGKERAPRFTDDVLIVSFKEYQP